MPEHPRSPTQSPVALPVSVCAVCGGAASSPRRPPLPTRQTAPQLVSASHRIARTYETSTC